MNNKSIHKQAQKNLFEKLSRISKINSNPSLDELNGYCFKNKQVGANNKEVLIQKMELEVAQKYLKQLESGQVIDSGEWDLNYPLHQFSFFTKEVISQLLQQMTPSKINVQAESKKEKQEDGQLPDKKTNRVAKIDKNTENHPIMLDKKIRPISKSVVSSLIPIKGISKAMEKSLRNLSIYDIPTLLSKGDTQSKRKQIAEAVGLDVKLINSWVKQADLWRIEEMDPDMAYLLVNIGIRSVSDLSRSDLNKIYPILEGLSASQPDFKLAEKRKLATLINNSKRLQKNSFDIQGISDLLKAMEAESAADEKKSNSTEIVLNINKVKDILNKTKISNSIFLEMSDKEPSYLFVDEEVSRLPQAEEIGEIITKGLGFLDEVQFALPLPHTLSGYVYKRKINESTKEKQIFSGARVEISGIVSPAEDKTEADINPSCYTDSTGRFLIVMPDRYSLKESVKIIISFHSYKQEFIKNASEIINAVPQQKQLEEFYELDSIGDRIDRINRQIILLEAEHTRILKGESSLNSTDDILKLIGKSHGDSEQEEGSLVKQLSALQTKYNTKKSILLESYANDDLELAFSEFKSSLNNLNAELEGNNLNQEDQSEGFVIIDEIFKGFPTDIRKALPSVKLMGNQENAIHLSTDTAPSRIFTYSMLQRLVEPAISSNPTLKDQIGRKTLNEPLDVMEFKTKLYTNPDHFPQMSSLGIGYVLNMHQAWVPDGFALGTLLYSLVLAPGEEQRLVVRENKQSYLISDEAEGSDSVEENYTNSQEDDTVAAFNYGVNSLSIGSSNSKYSTKSSSYGASAGGSWGGAMLGLSASFSRSSGSASAQAKQANSQNEASAAAQNFQHAIKSASDRISTAKRVSVSSATSEVSDSVATKIIANHNHSHTLTIQYWEVMRRYRMETCIDSVDLVLFVPLKMIPFLSENEPFFIEREHIGIFDNQSFNSRYHTLLQYATTLESKLAYKYRRGLNLIQKYGACPKWEMEKMDDSGRSIKLTFNVRLLFCDDLKAILTLKNGKGKVAGTMNSSYVKAQLDGKIETTSDFENVIRRFRNGENKHIVEGSQNIEYTFTLPDDVNYDDLSHIQLEYSCDSVYYQLYKNDGGKTDYNEQTNGELYKQWIGKYINSIEDNKDTRYDLGKMELFETLLPEAYFSPNLKRSSQQMKALGYPSFDSVSILTRGSNLSAMASDSVISNSVRIVLTTEIKTLRYSELQAMEETLQHIVSDTLHYSQIVWAGLSADERAMLMEQYTVNMDFNKIEGISVTSEDVEIPLLNCVDIKKMLGFYGNCMLLPFTYPQSLAHKLGRTAAEVQSDLYNYHTNCFRAPTTTISLPTQGMIGEAVLGETNVSELIDLTRFWNWQDSPIDKMEIDSSYLNGTDYLSNKTTKDITPLNLQSATATTPVSTSDLITALVNKQAPTFDNITGLNQIQEILTNATNTTASGRDNALNKSSELATSALTNLTNLAKAEKEAEKAKADLAAKKIDADKEEKKKENKKTSTEEEKTTPTAQTLEEAIKEAKEAAKEAKEAAKEAKEVAELLKDASKILTKEKEVEPTVEK